MFQLSRQKTKKRFQFDIALEPQNKSWNLWSCEVTVNQSSMVASNAHAKRLRFLHLRDVYDNRSHTELFLYHPMITNNIISPFVS